MNQLAERIASFFVTKSFIRQEEAHIYRYCFEIILSGIAFWGALLGIAFCTKTLYPTLIYLFGFYIFRRAAGGYHASTHFRCILLAIGFWLIFFFLVRWFPKDYYKHISIALVTFSYLLFLFFAPIDHENNPFTIGQRNSLRHKLFLTMLVFLICFAILLCCRFHTIAFYLAYGCGQAGCAILFSIHSKRKKGDTNVKLSY